MNPSTPTLKEFLDENEGEIEAFKARTIQLVKDASSKVETQRDYQIMAEILKKYLEEKGIESALICIGNADQDRGASIVLGPKPNLLEIIKYINGTLLKNIAPHVKVKMIIKRI